jgi:hypothetical protein
MTEETSSKQMGAMKRQKIEDEDDEVEEYEGRITRKMAEPEWMKRIDRIGKNVGSFTERVENFEQRMKDKEKIERKFREKTTEALAWQKAKLNSLWRVLKDMTDVIDEIDAVVVNKKTREVEVQTEKMTEKAEVEVEEVEKEVEEEAERTGEAEEKPEEVEEKAEDSYETEAEDGENEEDGEEVEETEETLKGDVEMAEV